MNPEGPRGLGFCPMCAHKGAADGGTGNCAEREGKQRAGRRFRWWAGGSGGGSRFQWWAGGSGGGQGDTTGKKSRFGKPPQVLLPAPG